MARISEINIETAPEAIQKIVADHVAEGHTITAEKRTLLHNAAAFNAVEAGSYALDDELARLIGKRAAEFLPVRHLSGQRVPGVQRLLLPATC